MRDAEGLHPLMEKTRAEVEVPLYSVEDWEGYRWRTMEIVLDWMTQKVVDLAPLVTHRFLLHAYRQALMTAMGKGHSHAFKVVFAGESVP